MKLLRAVTVNFECQLDGISLQLGGTSLGGCSRVCRKDKLNGENPLRNKHLQMGGI